jgi:hypothetical protein
VVLLGTTEKNKLEGNLPNYARKSMKGKVYDKEAGSLATSLDGGTFSLPCRSENNPSPFLYGEQPDGQRKL